ncbi:MAG: 4Fe-4S dicluster domain-containing protein [Candidatus Thorarchaeota archaeon]
MNNVLLRNYKSIIAKENEISLIEGTILSNDNSPIRFEIPLMAMKVPGFDGIPMTRKIIPNLLGSYSGIKKAVSDLEKNPKNPKEKTDEDFIVQLEDYAKSQGVSTIGYTQLPSSYVFQNKGVLYSNAIILTFEMDAELIEQAPSVNTFAMIHETYNKLGQASNALANFLRDNGYSAHASHPLGGIVLYPPLAEAAGLGYRGLHGLIITPEHGPRVRLAAVFTSIENLPFNGEFSHSWIGKFCQSCKKCVKTCPGKAMYDEPLKPNDDIITYVDQDKCFPYFLRDYGCTVCIKDCPFSKIDYYKIKNKFVEKVLITA